MADTHLRRLARGDLADLETEVRLLRARLRSGELSEERVKLAAMLGHAPARIATGVTRALAVADLARASAEFAAQAQVRVMVAAVTAAWPATHLFAEPRTVLLDYWQRVERWVCCPCDACSGELADVHEDFWILGFYECDWPFLSLCLELAADAAIGGLPPSPLRRWDPHARRETWSVSLEGDYPPQTVIAVHRQVLTEVIPWALGRGDIVAERVAAREAATP